MSAKQDEVLNSQMYLYTTPSDEASAGFEIRDRAATAKSKDANDQSSDF